MNITFQLARLGNLETLMTYMEAFHNFDHTEPFDKDSATIAMKKVLLDDTVGRVWLIQQQTEQQHAELQQTETIGYIVLTLAYRLEYRGYYAFLDELFIREDKRGQGIGTAALSFLDEACQKLGVSRLQLEVKQDNTLAGELYIRTGFKPQDRQVFLKDFSTQALAGE